MSSQGSRKHSYKAVVLRGLHTLNNEIHRELVCLKQALDAVPSAQTDEESAQLTALRRWLSLSTDLHQARLVGTKSILLRVELDRVIPNVLLKNNGHNDAVLTGEEAQKFQDGLSEAVALAKKSFEDNQRIQKEREPLWKFFANGGEAAQHEKAESTANPTPQPSSKVHPLEAKSWFRLIKVLYICLWAGCGGGCIFLVIATESVAWFIGSVLVLGVVLILLKRVFYYVTLGRATATEAPGTGFLDLDELRNDFAGLQTSNPDLYQQMVAPYLVSWKTQYGRRVPVQAYETFRKRIANEINALKEKKQRLIDDASKKGTTLEIAALRERMEQSKAEYKGADRQDYVRGIDAWLLRLEAKYGTSIRIDEASRTLDELEADIREKERALN